jgi:hypothetical protein
MRSQPGVKCIFPDYNIRRYASLRMSGLHRSDQPDVIYLVPHAYPTLRNVSKQSSITIAQSG